MVLRYAVDLGALLVVASSPDSPSHATSDFAALGEGSFSDGRHPSPIALNSGIHKAVLAMLVYARAGAPP